MCFCFIKDVPKRKKYSENRYSEGIDQTRGRVFPPISKHREVGWKNEGQPSFLTNFEVFENRRKQSFQCLI